MFEDLEPGSIFPSAILPKRAQSRRSAGRMLPRRRSHRAIASWSFLEKMAAETLRMEKPKGEMLLTRLRHEPMTRFRPSAGKHPSVIAFEAYVNTRSQVTLSCRDRVGSVSSSLLEQSPRHKRAAAGWHGARYRGSIVVSDYVMSAKPERIKSFSSLQQ